jgi:hypothetical protein
MTNGGEGGGEGEGGGDDKDAFVSTNIIIPADLKIGLSTCLDKFYIYINIVRTQELRAQILSNIHSLDAGAHRCTVYM